MLYDVCLRLGLKLKGIGPAGPAGLPGQASHLLAACSSETFPQVPGLLRPVGELVQGCRGTFAKIGCGRLGTPKGLKLLANAARSANVLVRV